MDAFQRMALPQRAARVLNGTHTAARRDPDALIRDIVYDIPSDDPFRLAAKPVRSGKTLNPHETAARRRPLGD